jgi:hypothetical protein
MVAPGPQHYQAQVIEVTFCVQGVSGPPCGVPSFTGSTRPPSITPAVRNARMSCSGREPGCPGPPAQVGSRTGASTWPYTPTRPRFQPPPRRDATCGFPALRAPICFMPRLMGPILPGQLSVCRTHAIAVVQLQGVIQPRPTPLLPAEAPLSPSACQMAPDLLLHPIFDVAEALTRVPDCEVVHPAPQLRIDQAHHPLDRLRPVSAEHLLELPYQRRPLFQLRRVMRPHRSA